jgi:hypothetical protein
VSERAEAQPSTVRVRLDGVKKAPDLLARIDQTEAGAVVRYRLLR